MGTRKYSELSHHPPSEASVSEDQTKSLTFSQITTMCLESKKDALKQSTYNQYWNQCNNHLLNEFGDEPFSSITVDQLNELLKRKMQEGYQFSTIMNLRTILTMILRYAVQNKIPTAITGQLFTPRYHVKEMEVFTRWEQKQIENLLYDRKDDYILAIFLSMYCGLRIGEVCALQWKDIHFRNGTLSVTKTLCRIQDSGNTAKKTYVASVLPKTHSSIRTIPIPTFLMPLLRAHRKKDTDYVITGTECSMEPRTCLRRYKTILKHANVSNYSFHALRHTFATRCVETGMDPKSLSEILGHSTVKITLDRYVHPSMDYKRTQMNRLKKVTKLDV